jgi:hypothetical protein
MIHPLFRVFDPPVSMAGARVFLAGVVGHRLVVGCMV